MSNEFSNVLSPNIFMISNENVSFDVVIVPCAFGVQRDEQTFVITLFWSYLISEQELHSGGKCIFF